MGQLTGEWKNENGIWFQKEKFERWVRYEELICAHCGKSFRTRHIESQTCSKRCMAFKRWKAIPKKERFKASRYHRKGYIYIRHPETNHEILEHRYFMEKILKRPLQSNEFIHHINGKKDDNRPENLLLMTRFGHNSIHKSEEAKHRARGLEGRFLPKH